MHRTSKYLRKFGLLLIVFFSHLCFSQAAQTPGSEKDKAISAAGRGLFNSSCAECHGLDGHGGDKGANLATSAEIQNLSDIQLGKIISEGILEVGMPAFRTLNEQQVLAVVGYVRTLQGRNGSGALPGDAKRGKELFFGKGDCSTCHMISGEGGFLGPDLTNHGAISSASGIRDEIVRSPRLPSQSYRIAALTTGSGDQLEGTVRNEDNFSVQLQTKDGAYHLFKKSQLKDFKVLDGSSMPANYRDRLSSSELDDVASYLMTTADVNKAILAHKQAGDEEGDD
ncbi:MAG: c-type cytochrome [Candidatus Sulfotelmatobacter sp.]